MLKRQLSQIPAAIYKVPRAPPDKILGLTEKFDRDKNGAKVNLTVGIYKDNWGHVTTFNSVAKAQMVLDQSFEMNTDLSYLPIKGCPDFQINVLSFLYRDSCPRGATFLDQNRISFVQTLSGTGALAVASKLLSLFMSRSVWIPNPSWPNHANVFQNNGFKEINYYSYYKDGSLDIEGWIQDLEKHAQKEGEDPQCIVLHACCHNPTGIDPSKEQWQRILDKIHELNLIPIIDMAYQGLDSGDLYKDAYLLNMSLDENRYQWKNGLFLCQSFAKNMGLYGERVGSLSVVTPPDSKLKVNVDSQLKKIVRGMYSSPPGYGSRVANLVLSTPHLKEEWFEDVKNVANRLQYVKAEMGKRLDWPSLHKCDFQHGMFLYTGLSTSEVDSLREKYSVYLVQDGRLSLSGLNDANMDYVCDALKKVRNN